jgi:hypothetical protein
VATKISIAFADQVDRPLSIGSTNVKLVGDYSIGRCEGSRLMEVALSE